MGYFIRSAVFLFLNQVFGEPAACTNRETSEKYVLHASILARVCVRSIHSVPTVDRGMVCRGPKNYELRESTPVSLPSVGFSPIAQRYILWLGRLHERNPSKD